MNTQPTAIPPPDLLDLDPSQPDAVATSMRIAVSRASVWERLMFYEQLDQRPPLHLRLLLPVPIRTIGEKSHVGDEARCLYEGGHLIKRITEVEPEHLYAFDVIEQSLPIGGGMTLVGGAYRLDDQPLGATVVTLSTRYISARRPRWLWRPIEAAVCHSFHRHILGAIRRNVEAA